MCAPSFAPSTPCLPKNMLRSVLPQTKKNTPISSFSPLLFIISAEGGGDEQCSEAGIQEKYASGVAGHNTRRSRVIPFTPLQCLPLIILSAYRACRDARRRVETGVSPCQKGGAEGIPIRLPIFRYALLWCAAHSVTHLMCAPSFAPSTPCLPKNILRSPTFARTRATDSSHTSHGCSAALAAADALRTLSLAYSPPCCVALRHSVAHILNVLLTPSRLARLA